MSVRTERMINSAPDYYQFSKVYAAIQGAQGGEYDSLETKAEDLRNQLYIVTATWGLKYWEAAAGISVNENDSYETRRSRVLAHWRGVGNFSANLIKTVCGTFGASVSVSLNPPNALVIKLITPRGIPDNITDIQAAVDNIVHAHLGYSFSYTYLIWDELDAASLTWDELDAMGTTWREFEAITF